MVSRETGGARREWLQACLFRVGDHPWAWLSHLCAVVSPSWLLQASPDAFPRTTAGVVSGYGSQDNPTAQWL